MNTNEFLKYMDSGRPVKAGSEVHHHMLKLMKEAQKHCMKFNTSYLEHSEVIELFSQLTGRKVSTSLRINPPCTVDCGKNLHIGKNVYINAGCRFQDQGGITLQDGVILGHNVVIATVNHLMDPEKRDSMHIAPVTIGERVWIGANSTVCPGVTIGKGAIIGAGSVVTKDIPPFAVAVGSPARVVKRVEDGKIKETLELRKL